VPRDNAESMEKEATSSYYASVAPG
jgi:hypothetical protein